MIQPSVAESVVLLTLGYYLLAKFLYLFLHTSGVVGLVAQTQRRVWEELYQPFSSVFLPGIAVIVPAYNEAESIERVVQSVLDLDYPAVDLIVVNDGSTDATMERLTAAFDLTPVPAGAPVDLPCEPVCGIYRAEEIEGFLVIDKEKGGKSDALNAGIWLTEQPLFCVLDADTVIVRDGLLRAVRPFLVRPSDTVATGGTIHVGARSGGEDDTGPVGFPGRSLASLQILEYLQGFYSGRLGMEQLGGLVLISGAFGVFKTDLVREIGGYTTDSVTEDFELVMRIHRHLAESGRDYRVTFVPDPIARTDVPGSFRALARQRRRWYRGLVDTLLRYRGMLANPRYGRAGLVVLPIVLVVEAIGPILEGLGYLVVPLLFVTGQLSLAYTAFFFGVTIGVGIFLSWLGIVSEVVGFRRYDHPHEVLWLLATGIVENLGYQQWKTLVKLHGLVQYVRGIRSWDPAQ